MCRGYSNELFPRSIFFFLRLDLFWFRKTTKDPHVLAHIHIVSRWGVYKINNFDVHVTVHRVKCLILKLTRCTNFWNLFLEWNSTCFGEFLCPSSGIFHCTHSNGICHICLLTVCSQQTCMTYTNAKFTVKNSWWWKEELSETCRISFQE